jgi:hypothetical protein
VCLEREGTQKSLAAAIINSISKGVQCRCGPASEGNALSS